MVSTKRLFDAASHSCVQESKNRTVGSAVAGLVPCHPRVHSGDYATSCVRGVHNYEYGGRTFESFWAASKTKHLQKHTV